MPLESQLVHLFLEPGAVIAEIVGVHCMNPALGVIRVGQLDRLTASRTFGPMLVSRVVGLDRRHLPTVGAFRALVNLPCFPNELVRLLIPLSGHPINSLIAELVQQSQSSVVVRLEVIAPDCRKRVDLVDYKLVVDVHADLPDPVLQRQLKSLDEGLVLRALDRLRPPDPVRKI